MKRLFCLFTLLSCLFINACSCSKVKVSVENGKIISEGTIKKNSNTKIVINLTLSNNSSDSYIN